MLAATFALSFLLGKLASTLLYQATWANGLERRFHAGSALITFLARPWPWLVHLPVLALSLGLDWRDHPGLHIFTGVASGALALGAVGRWGAVDLGRFFLLDRLLIVALGVGVWFSPACLYPLLLACCCLQYTVAGWPLNPGYSNLLGYEFMRSTLCMVLAGLLVRAPESLVTAVVLCGQAAGYVQQALAKSALGKHWYSWILENRLQCLLVNSHLRGWGGWIRTDRVLRLAGWMGRIKVPLCAAVWLMESGWILILLDTRIALGILLVTSLFHLAVSVLTGLAGYHYLLSHGLMMALLSSPAAAASATVSRLEFAWVGGCCILISTLWVLLLRRHLFRAYTRHGKPGPAGRLLDPADHLMAWWDGPYMRMYSYSVTGASGRRYHFPVTRFSPYDTFLTDIHTHLMILGREWALDPQLKADRALIRTGVWGLTASLSERDTLYQWMDTPRADLNVLLPAAEVPGSGPSPESAAFMIDFFQGLNRARSSLWFRILLRWPHFPGEDWVPDWSPLAGERLAAYAGQEPVTEVACHRVKTFYRNHSIQLLEDHVFARLPIFTQLYAKAP